MNGENLSPFTFTSTVTVGVICLALWLGGAYLRQRELDTRAARARAKQSRRHPSQRRGVSR